MPLVQCPACGKDVSDIAPACPACGRPMHPQTPVVEPPEASGDWRCPACGGTDLKKHSLIYQETRHTSTSTSKAAGIGVVRGGIGIGIGGARSSGVTLSDLARRAAPPDKEQIAQATASGGGLLLTLGTAALAAFLANRAVGLLWAVLAFIAVFLIGVVLSGARGAPELERQYRAALDRWNRSYMCMRCGASVERVATGELLTQGDFDPELDILLREN